MIDRTGMTPAPRFDAFTYMNRRHVIIADGVSGPVVHHTALEARELAAKLIAAADEVDQVTTLPLRTSERRRIASQAMALANSGADVCDLRNALRHWARDVLAGNTPVGAEGEYAA